MEKITTIGLDIAKHVFQVHGINGAGATVSRRSHFLPMQERSMIAGVEGAGVGRLTARNLPPFRRLF